MIARFGRDTVGRALALAELTWSNLNTGHHPDDGLDCLYLEADIREYSAFLVALAVQYRHVDNLLVLADQVRLQHTETGDTRFWLPGVRVTGL